MQQNNGDSLEQFLSLCTEFPHGLYFCGQYRNTDADGKKVERDMFKTVPHFLGSNDRYKYEWEKQLAEFFSYFYPDI